MIALNYTLSYSQPAAPKYNWRSCKGLQDLKWGQNCTRSVRQEYDSPTQSIRWAGLLPSLLYYYREKRRLKRCQVEGWSCNGHELNFTMNLLSFRYIIRRLYTLSYSCLTLIIQFYNLAPIYERKALFWWRNIRRDDRRNSSHHRRPLSGTNDGAMAGNIEAQQFSGTGQRPRKLFRTSFVY